MQSLLVSAAPRSQSWTAAFGPSPSYTLAYSCDNAPWDLPWVEGSDDLTCRLDGSYTFTPSGDDTEVGFGLLVDLVDLVDLVVPIPAFVKGRAGVRNMRTALQKLKARAETAE